MAMNKFSLFGFSISKNVDQSTQQSFTPPASDDGALTITSAAYYGTAIDMDSTAKNDVELISRYREMAMQPEIESAIDDIVNEAICQDDDGKIIQIVLDDLKQPAKIKDAIKTEFDTVLKMLNYTDMAQDIFRRYYTDGRLHYHVLVDKEQPTAGIKELRYIDPRKLKKVREIKKQKDDRTGVEVVNTVNEYYLFNDKVTTGSSSNYGPVGTRITTDSIVSIVSGLMDSRRAVVLSYLHKCIKPLNQLRMIEDATVIYRICLVGDTRVKTNTGYKYIKDIKANDTVYSFNAQGIFEAPVKSAWSNGVKPVYKVKSKHHSITGTVTHPVLVYDDTTKVVEYIDIEKIDTTKHSFVWETAKNTAQIVIPKIHNDAIKLDDNSAWVDLIIEDKEKYVTEIAEKFGIKRTSTRNFLYGLQFLEKEVATNILDYIGISNEVTLSEKTEGHCSNQLNLPEFVDVDFAELFGFLIGDGSLRKNTITFAEGVYPELNERYSGLLTQFFGNCSYQKSDRKYSNYVTSSTLGVGVLHAMGWIDGAYNKRIPEWAYCATDEIKLAFILGLSAADGAERVNEITGRWQTEIELCNKQLIEDIKELWTSLGFASGHIRYRKRKAEFRAVGDELKERMIPETESWSVYLSNVELSRFEKISSVEYVGEEEVFDLEVDSEKHNFVANGVVVHNSRAPERRIFYIDVGNLPKLKAEQYLRDIMVKYKNKLVYDANTGEVRDDRKFLSMMEDFWLPRREGGKGTEITTLPGGCFAMDTKVSLLDGRELSIKDIEEEMKTGKELWTYSCHPKTGEIVPGLISWAGVTHDKAKVMRITLDNGKSFVCTPDHKFPIYGQEFKRAMDFTVGESLIPLYRRKEIIAKGKNNEYEQYFNNSDKKWEFTHRMVADYLKDSVVHYKVYDESVSNGSYDARHHIDFNRFNNDPQNLCFMSWGDHTKLHQDNISHMHKHNKQLKDDPVEYAKFIEKLRNGIKNYYDNMSDEDREIRSKQSSKAWENYTEEEYKEICEKIGVGVAQYVEGLSPEEREIRRQHSIAAFKIGNVQFNHLMDTDPEFRASVNEKRSVYWTDENRAKHAAITGEHSKKRWTENENMRIDHRERQKLVFSNSMITFIIDLVKGKTTHEFTLKDVLVELNNSADMLTQLCELNKHKSVPNWNINIGFTPTIITKLVKQFGYDSWKDFRVKESVHNHRVTKIEYLDDEIQVGTLTIDIDEVYHDYHTFALAAECFVFNSNLGELEDVKYFEKKLYKSLNVPISRLDPQSSGFSLGRVGEITRDELKFAKFVGRMRAKFSDLFDQCLRVQCVLKGICTDEEWRDFKEHIHYNFIKDNNFTELKEAELMKERLSLLGEVDPYTGRYFSQAWIQRNVLRLTDDEIVKMESEIEEEKEAGMGLPVQVMNDVAQQQMMANIGQEDNEHQAELDRETQSQAAKQQAALIKKQVKKEEFEPTLNIVKRALNG